MTPLPALALFAALAAAAPEASAPRPVPEFSFVDQDGRDFRRLDLLGKVWIAEYVYTRCTAECPLLTAGLKLVERDLAGREVSFLAFSVDPEGDTPAALKAYARRWKLDPKRWRLLNTRDFKTVRAFGDAMGTVFSSPAAPGGSIQHSERFTLIDASGLVRGAYDSTDEAAVAALVRDASALAGRPAAPAPAEPATAFEPWERGRDLMDSLGCAACHAEPSVAPRLEGLAGSVVTLRGGRSVMADEAYLRASILAPDSEVVEGYPPMASGYAERLTPAQVDALVAYLVRIGRRPGAPEGAAALRRATAVDPVCGMTVSAGEGTPRALTGGVTTYFCSDACRERFVRDPSAFPARR